MEENGVKKQAEKPKPEKKAAPDMGRKMISKVTDLILDEHNANLGTERGKEMLARSLREYGAGRSVLVDKKGRIVAGNKTVQQAIAAGIEDLLVIETDGSQLVAVKRMDLDLEDGDKARGLAYADNRTSEVGLDWNLNQLLADLEGNLDLSGSFRQDELDELLEGIVQEEPPEDVPPQIDKAAELQEKWNTATGQIWQLGEHRLAVGDCIDEAVTEAMMKGEGVQLIYTDPPYGETDCDWDKQFNWGSLADQWSKLLIESGHLVLFGKVGFLLEIYEALKHKFEYRMEEIWKKPQSDSPGQKKRFLQIHENIWWFKLRKSSALYFDIDAIKTPGEPYTRTRKASTVVDYANTNYVAVSDGRRWPLSVIESNQPRFGDETVGHPTQKPLVIVERDISVGTPKDSLIYDPFLGSGTTLIACERLNRRCRAIEIEPKYCAVTIQRWVDLTGGKPKLIE